MFDVYVNTTLAGTLEQVDLSKFVFTYASGANESAQISLAMPITKQEWTYFSLHPVFQVSLPEGGLRETIARKFSKAFNRFSDLELLAVVGRNLVGRLSVVPHGHPLPQQPPQETLKDLLKASSGELLDYYLDIHAQYSGVSGGFPKFLAATTGNQGQPSPLAVGNWIVKGGDADHPEIVRNEYFCMMVAKRMGLPVPEFHISDDAKRLVIRRFDIRDNGERLGFEDMCALMGLEAKYKFSGSVERIVKIVNDYCKPVAATESKHQFYAQYLACMAIRNGDAHLKNFGLVYESKEDARLAPVYDMLTMCVYARRAQNGDTLDQPALALDGAKRWPSTKSLAYLSSKCGIASAWHARTVQQMLDAIEATARDIRTETAKDPGFCDIGKKMLTLWGHGVYLHSPELSNDLFDLAASVESKPQTWSNKKQRP